MGEKTEQATQKKLRDARKKGQVAKSQDLPAAFTFMTSISVILGLFGYLYSYLSNFLIGAYKLIGHEDLPRAIMALFFQAIEVIFLACIPVLVIVASVGVLVNFLAVGPVFATEVFKFDIKKFNPVTNLKAKFKLKTLVELLKSIFKISVACYIIYGVMVKSIPALAQTVTLPISSALIVFYSFLVEVVAKVGLLFLGIATIDFIYQKRAFATEMKMEKFEVKQEYKNTEGDPHIKGKRRQIAQEIAYQDGPTGAVRRAQAVITNPTHLAVAIGYEKDMDVAPYILAMGADLLAEQMIKIAERYEVPIMRNIPLARKLWEEGEIYEYVPEETYGPLAEILRWIATMQEGVDKVEPYEPSQ